MEYEKQEQLINKILISMVNIIEEHGCRIDGWFFELDEEKEEKLDLINRTGITEPDFTDILKSCISRNYIKRAYSNGYTVKLTEEGQGRGISAKVPPEQNIKPSGNFSIGELNVTNSGQFQVGNNNQIQIEKVITSLIKEIDSVEGSDEDKVEAKSRLKAFIEHPLVTSLVGAASASLIGLL